MADAADLAGRPGRKIRRSASSHSVLWAMPAAIFLLLFFFVPLGGVIWISLTAGPNGAVSLLNYTEFFSNSGNLKVLGWTFALAAVVTVICVLTAYPVAYLIRRASPGISGLILLAVLLPYFTSYLVRTYAWMVLLGRFGPVNQLVVGLGLSDEPLRILYSSWGVIIGMTYILLPYCVLIMVSVMKGIPDQLIRAAASLGASRTNGFLRIFLPLSAPGVVPAALLTFIFALGFYITPVLLGGRGDVTVPMLVDTSVNTTLNWPAGATAAVVLLAVTLVVYAAANRFMRIEKLLSPRQELADQGDRRAPSAKANAAYVSILDAISRFRRRYLFPNRTDYRKGKQSTRRLGNLVPGISSLVVLFLLSPLFIIIPISFSSSNFLSFPPPGLSLRWYNSVFSSGDWTLAIWQSVKIGTLSAIFSVVIGTGAALFITRTTARLRAWSFQLLLAPMIVPSIVGSVALYFLFAKLQMIGSIGALALAHSVVAVPIVVLIVSAGLQAVDPRVERAAASLGAPPSSVLWRVTIPLIRPSLLISAFLAFLHSFDEVVYALFLSGPRLVTLPVRMWSGVRDEISPTIAAVSSLLLLTTVIVYALAEISRHRQLARKTV